MGLYDLVRGMQVKATPNPEMHDYDVGDTIPLADGLYICYEGAFVVDKGTIAWATVDEWTEDGKKLKDANIFDKWGESLDPKEILDSRNPVAAVAKAVSRHYKDHKGGY